MIEVTEEVLRSLRARCLVAARNCAPQQNHDTHNNLFEYARKILGIERKQKVRFRGEHYFIIYKIWEELAHPFLREDHDYFTEFLGKLGLVNYPEGAALADAFARAQKAKPPREALCLPNPQAHLVAALCRELQRDAGEEPFFLDGRSCAQLLGHPNHTSVALWLTALRGLGVLKLVQKGVPGRASRYRYTAEWDDKPRSAPVSPIVKDSADLVEVEL